MIVCKCKTTDTVKLLQMTPFQGTLKKRTDKDIEDMIESIVLDGLIMPFALWRKDDHYFILDGHGRYSALVKAALGDASILDQEFPAIFIDAETEDEARKSLLQIVSTYGKISVPGVIKFSAPVSGYKAPVIKSLSVPTSKPKVKNDKVVIRLRVDRTKVEALTAILKTVTGVEIW